MTIPETNPDPAEHQCGEDIDVEWIDHDECSDIYTVTCGVCGRQRPMNFERYQDDPPEGAVIHDPQPQ